MHLKVLKYLLLIPIFASGESTIESEIFYSEKPYNRINGGVEKFVGSTIMNEEDGCEPNPCKNNGICVMSGTDIDCICKEPYTGARCEIDPCKPNPCKNNGSCVPNDEGFQCRCEMPYVGLLCEEVVDLCEENPCENGGSCRIENGQYQCDCVGPYAGKNCEQNCDCGDAVCELDENGLKKECNCTDKQILFEGKCVDCDCGDGTCQLDKRGNKKCICYKNQTLSKGKCIECDCGKYATHCYFDSKGKKQCVCLPGTAQLGGNCSVCDCGNNSRSCLFNDKGDFICYCKPGFSQRNNTCYESCKSDKDCFNEGTCKKGDSGGSFCKCQPDFSGGRCQTDNICESMKERCQEMSSICVRNGSKRLCECLKGKLYSWKSGICEDICDDKICNFGTCIVTGKNFKCLCKKGYTGSHCHEMIKRIDQDSGDATYLIVVLVILCIAIVAFFIGTIYLFRRNAKLQNYLERT